MTKAQRFLCASLGGPGSVFTFPADDDAAPDFAGRARRRKTAKLLRADRDQIMTLKQRGDFRRRLALCVIAAADAQQAGAAQQFHAIVRAISIICVKVSRTAWLPRLSPVKGLSEMVSSVSAFMPAAAALR